MIYPEIEDISFALLSRIFIVVKNACLNINKLADSFYYNDV